MTTQLGQGVPERAIIDPWKPLGSWSVSQSNTMVRLAAAIFLQSEVPSVSSADLLVTMELVLRCHLRAVSGVERTYLEPLSA